MQVRVLVQENEELHSELQQAAQQLEGRSLAAAACMVAGQGGDMELARLQVRAFVGADAGWCGLCNPHTVCGCLRKKDLLVAARRLHCTSKLYSSTLH